MNREPLPPTPPELSTLEVLGALCSRLVHDLKNKLAVIAGNAQFAEILRQDPQRMLAALTAIRRSSEEAAKFLEHMALLRRDLSWELLPAPVEDTVAAVRAVGQQLPGWPVRADEAPRGQLVVPPRWTAFVVRQLARESRSAVGQIELAPLTVPPPTDPNQLIEGPGPGNYFQITLRHPVVASPPASPENDPTKHILSMAARELVRRAGGSLLEPDPVGGHKEISLVFPWLPPEGAPA